MKVKGWLFMLIPMVIFSAFKDKEMHGYHISGVAQGTTYHITYYSTDSVVAHAEIDSLLDQIDSSLSTYKSYSIISRFNRSDKGVKMDVHLRKVITKSLEIWKATKGISDPTVYSLVNIWGFGPERNRSLPDSAAIHALLHCVGSDKILIRGNMLLKSSPCVKIDLNGIAQGYSIDVVADFLKKKGVKNYLVEIGGEVTAMGNRYPQNEPMRVGIESPPDEQSPSSDIYKIIPLENGALTTSGNTRKVHMVGGKRVSHLIDPFTGYPFSNELLSVSVLAKDGITADGYDNALMGMGLKKALAFMKRHPEMQAYFIYTDPGGAMRDTATVGFPKGVQR